MANWLPLAVAGAALPTVTYIGAVTPSLAGQVATATNANIGTASADRLVVVVFFDINETSTSAPATVTIGGTSATVHIFQTGAANNVMGICSLLVTSGTTATIAVTYSGAGSQGGGQFGIYNLNRLSSTTPVGTGGAWNNVVNPLSATLATSSGGIVIVGA